MLSELLNKRGPAAWLVDASPPGPAAGGTARTLTCLALDCLARNQVLLLRSPPAFDLVLVPREACAEDGVAFAAFATRVRASAASPARAAASRPCIGKLRTC